MIQPIYIVDIIGSVVSAVSDQILSTIITNETNTIGKTSLIEVINYQYGHKRELMETLQQFDRAPDFQAKKFPLIWLVMDFIEQRGRTVGFYSELTLNIIIAHHTDPTYKTMDRYNMVFKPVLYPIYYSLLDQLAHTKGIEQGNESLIRHSKIDRTYWGTADETKNQITDYVDAIEINNLGLIINHQCFI